MEDQEIPLPVKFEQYVTDEKRQVALAQALPKHISASRMSRLAMLAFNGNRQLQECHPGTIFSSLLVAATMGLEIGVDGQGYLVPYNGVCTFVPGWKGIVDIVGRSGKAVVWTGAVYSGDDFDFALGSAPFVTHRPASSSKKERTLEWAYAIGSITGTDRLVIEVWSREQLDEHFDANVPAKLKAKHYRHKHEEMYFRKVPLLQVCKYMPKSIELSNALAAAYAAENGDTVKAEDGMVIVERVDPETGEVEPQAESEVRQPQRRAAKPTQPVQDVQAKERPSSASNTTESSQPATEGERAWVKRKAGAGLALLLEDAGAASLEALTKAQLAKCRELLAAVPA